VNAKGSAPPRARSASLALIVMLALPLAIAIGLLASRGWVAAPLIALLLLVVYTVDRGSSRAKVAAMAIALAVILAYGAALVDTTVANVANPPQWDFRAFWILARVADLGQDFYDPANARFLAGAFQNTPDFLPELVFLYPPPTMFMILPLGWFDINTASAGWGLVHGLILALDIWLAWKLFLRDQGFLGLLLAAAAILLLRGTLQTIEYGQTNFLVLFFVLLVWRDRDRPRAGFWLALGTLVKPIVAFLGLFLLARRRWPAVAVAVATGVTLVGLSIVAFGVDTFSTYFVDNPAANAPAWAYTEDINQSVLAMIMRAEHITRDAHPLMNPGYLAAVLAIGATTIFVCMDREAVSDELALSLLLPTALLLYPSSTMHYTVVLIVPILYLISRRQAIPGGPVAVAAVVIGVYALAGGLYSFFAVAALWLVLTGLAVRSMVETRQLARRSVRGELTASEVALRRTAILARY
jgi:Glycosyltransferase family 87